VASLALLLLLLVEPPAPAPDSGSAASKASAPAESRTIVGEIVWVDLPSRLVLIRESVKTTRVKGQPPARQTVAMSVAPDVSVTRGKKVVALDELKAKDHVTARYVATETGAKALSFRVAEATPTPRPASGDAPSTAGGN